MTNIRMFRSRSEKKLAALRLLENELEAPSRGEVPEGASPEACENDPYVLMAVKFGRRVYEAHLKWCVEAETAIDRR